jgi:DNA-binding MarR family transcriptional regulator
MPAAPAKHPAGAKAENPVNQQALLGLLGYNCLQAYLSLIPFTKKRLAKYSLRPVEFTVLSLIKANPDINQKRLGQTLNISPPNLATLLDRMESNRLLTRQRNPLDRRSQSLVLTPEGSSACAKAETALEKAEKGHHLGINKALSNDERTELLRLLQKVFLRAADN